MPMLIFRIDVDAPDDYMDQWNKFKSKCIDHDPDIINEIKNNCKIENNKIMVNLEGTCNYIVNEDYSFLREDDIILNGGLSIDSEKWTYDEMDDLIEGVLTTANKNVKGECVNGYIKG